MITREQALKILETHLKNQNLKRHCLAVETVMKALAQHFKEDENLWAIVGLLHDGDYEETKNNPKGHTIKMAQWLKDSGETDEEIISAILSHNFSHTGNNPSTTLRASPPKNNLEWSLYCCDELTGLIVAVALVRPDKKLASVTVESIIKKWNVSQFAAGVDRKQITMCEEKLDIKLADFIAIALESMQKIARELGL